MRKVSVIVYFVAACFFPLCFAKAGDGAFQNRLSAVVEYQNSFKNYVDLLSEMQAFGGITAEERAEIENVLKSNGVSLETPMQQGRVEGRSIIWGSYRLTFYPDGRVKTQNGRIISKSKNEGRDLLFKKTLSALKNQNLSVNSLLIPAAYANALKDAVSVTTAALGKTLITAVTTINTPLCGAVAVPVDGLLWTIKKLVFEGTVSCTEYGEYVMNHCGEFWAQFAKNYNEPNKKLTHPVGYSKKLESAFNSVCYGPFARAMGEKAKSSSSRLKQDKVDESHLRVALSIGIDGAIPRCTRENAKVVEKYIKDEAKKIDDFAKQSLVDARFGKNANHASGMSTHEKIAQ